MFESNLKTLAGFERCFINSVSPEGTKYVFMQQCWHIVRLKEDSVIQRIAEKRPFIYLNFEKGAFNIIILTTKKQTH